MSTKPNLAKIAHEILNRPPFEKEEDNFAFMDRVAGHLNDEQFQSLKAIMNHERTIRQAELDRELADHEVMEEIFSGLPKVTTFYEACQIKAAQGHKRAQYELDRMNSRECRLNTALFDAAADAHPGWERDNDVYTKLDPNAPEDLVEWFQTTHPREARAIEDAIA